MRSEEIRKILAHGTNMTERDIERHIKDGVSVYDNTEAGYKDYEQECIAGLNDSGRNPGNVGKTGNSRERRKKLQD